MNNKNRGRYYFIIISTGLPQFYGAVYSNRLFKLIFRLVCSSCNFPCESAREWENFQNVSSSEIFAHKHRENAKSSRGKFTSWWSVFFALFLSILMLICYSRERIRYIIFLWAAKPFNLPTLYMLSTQLKRWKKGGNFHYSMKLWRGRNASV